MIMDCPPPKLRQDKEYNAEEKTERFRLRKIMYFKIILTYRHAVVNLNCSGHVPVPFNSTGARVYLLNIPGHSPNHYTNRFGVWQGKYVEAHWAMHPLERVSCDSL